MRFSYTLPLVMLVGFAASAAAFESLRFSDTVQDESGAGALATTTQWECHACCLAFSTGQCTDISATGADEQDAYHHLVDPGCGGSIVGVKCDPL
jgi:hypothetical protein